MFTGIIEEVGHVRAIEVTGQKRRVIIAFTNLLPELKLGDSISVSGVCLTAVNITEKSFSADLAQETWLRTSLSRLEPGALVNLELPMRASGRFDGHIVQGHVDGTGTLVSLAKIPDAKDYLLTINVPSELTHYIVAKGSLAVEGISLTVAGIEGTAVTIAIIPHTAEITNLKSLRPDDPLNLEVDVVAKYVEKMMPRRGAQSSITLEKLVSEGF
ncbi:MAG: riboflavin synthase [Acidobacteria bacterium]|nr:MAG: riboflavin synthase [Acidobacteriota bacterium]